MPGTQDAEVATIERGELRLVHSFDDGQHGRIDEADVRVRVAIAELPDAHVVRGLQVSDPVRASLDVRAQSSE